MIYAIAPWENYGVVRLTRQQGICGCCGATYKGEATDIGKVKDLSHNGVAVISGAVGTKSTKGLVHNKDIIKTRNGDVTVVVRKVW